MLVFSHTFEKRWGIQRIYTDKNNSYVFERLCHLLFVLFISSTIYRICWTRFLQSNRWVRAILLQVLLLGKGTYNSIALTHEMSFNPFPNKPWFLRVYSINLLKTLWEKEKLLVTSNFSFSHSVFYPFEELSAIFINFEIVVW